MAAHASAMHSIPPLVTISSPASGRRPCPASWRSARWSRTLASPSTGVYWSATPGSSLTSRAAISPSTSVANVAGLGKPPVNGSTPGGVPARIAASSSPPRALARRANRWVQSARVDIDREGERAVAAGVERRHVLGVVGLVVQGLAAADGGEDGALLGADQLGGLERGLDLARGRDDDAVVVGEDDVARGHVDAAAAHGRSQRRARGRAAGGGQRAAREHWQPERPQAVHVPAVPVDDDAGEPAAARLRGEELAEHGEPH